MTNGQCNSSSEWCQNVPVKTAEDMMGQIVKYLQGDLDKVNTTYILQDNKRQRWEAEQECETASLEDFT